jgi:hypothetical protein
MTGVIGWSQGRLTLTDILFFIRNKRALGEKQMDTIILGQNIGSNTDWDQQDVSVFTFYGFKPVESLSIPECECLTVDFEQGLFQIFEGEGDTFRLVFQKDIIETLKDLHNRNL